MRTYYKKFGSNEPVNKRYGYVVTVKYLYRDRTSKEVWLCRCNCGKLFKTRLNGLKTNNTRSCGCLMLQTVRTLQYKHGATAGRIRTKEYLAWTNMKARCNNPKDPRFKHYGGRGIRVCKNWDQSFTAFITDMGKAPHSYLELDRINNEDGYYSENCRWTTRAEQVRNRRHLTRKDS